MKSLQDPSPTALSAPPEPHFGQRGDDAGEWNRLFASDEVRFVSKISKNRYPGFPLRVEILKFLPI